MEWKRSAAAAVVLLGCAVAARADGPTTQPVTTRAATTRPGAVEFLAGDAARAAIVDDHLDPYFDRLRPAEMSMKTASPITGDTPEQQHAEVRRRYRAGVREFTADERAALTYFVDKIRPALVRDYPVFGGQPFRFLKVADTIEGGMPHTRGDQIVMPEGVLAGFVAMRSGGDRATPGAVSLLVHEQTHVLQRLHPDLFVPLYTGVYGFVRAERIEPNADLDARQLINPDGTVCDWVLPMVEGGKAATVLPLIAFENDHPRQMVRDMNVYAVTLEPTGKPGEYKVAVDADGKPVVRPLNGVGPYTAVAGRGGDNYHPNEIAADAFSRLVVTDELLSGAVRDPARAAKLEARNKPVRDWAKAAFRG